MSHRREDHHALRRRWPAAFLVAIGGSLARRLFPLRVEGGEHLPATGPAIIAANHLSFFDHVALVLSVGRRVTFVGKVEYVDRWRTRLVLPALGMIPIDRRSPRRAVGALERAADVLRADELFAIYPEGTRSRDGALHAGHAGVGQLSVTTGAPVVPTGIIGTERIQPPGARLPRPFTPAVVRFGAPINPTSYSGTRRERRRRITDDVMQEIAELTGQARGDDVGGHDHGVDAGVTAAQLAVGETLDIDERVVVAPATGLFTPLASEGAQVEVGEPIGRVCTRATEVDVCTPFRGQLVAMTASEGERVDRCQRVAWLRRRH
jgi:1-acyl-sn-glycerol-3-phosphate acyltransferase